MAGRSEFDDGLRLPAYRCKGHPSQVLVVRTTPRAQRYSLFTDDELSHAELHLSSGEWCERTYSEGEIHGTQSTYYATGNLKRRDEFHNGACRLVESWHPNGEMAGRVVVHPSGAHDETLWDPNRGVIAERANGHGTPLDTQFGHERRVVILPEVEMEFAYVPGGWGLVGGFAPGEFGVGPSARCLARFTPFWLARTAVPQNTWRSISQSTPWLNELGEPLDEAVSSARGPACYIDYHKALEFCERLALRTGLQVSVPSSAEFEYAMRAGSQSEYWTGNEEPDLGQSDVSSMQLVPIGEAPSGPEALLDVDFGPENPLGLRGLLTGCRNWCSDFVDPGYTGYGIDGCRGPVADFGLEDWPSRCTRGSFEWHCRNLTCFMCSVSEVQLSVRLWGSS